MVTNNKANIGLIGGVIVAVAGLFGITPTPEDVTIVSGAIAAVVSACIIVWKYIRK